MYNSELLPSNLLLPSSSSSSLSSPAHAAACTFTNIGEIVLITEHKIKKTHSSNLTNLSASFGHNTKRNKKRNTEMTNTNL
jgi:hypothetical protein